MPTRVALGVTHLNGMALTISILKEYPPPSSPPALAIGKTPWSGGLNDQGLLDEERRNTMLDLNKPVQTRDGRPARILATDAKGRYPIVALITMESGREEAVRLTEYGSVFYEEDHHLDLVNVSEKRVMYINVFKSGYRSTHYSAENAENFATGIEQQLIARVRIEYEEGQFDE